MRILGYILVVLFVTTSAFGQQINPVPDYIFRYQMSVGRNAPTDTAAYLSVGPRYGANKGLMPPMVVDTNAVTGVKRNGLLIFSVQLNNFAYWDSTTSRFRKITAEAVVDSVVFATRAWRKKGDDSLGAVISQRTDTALLSTRAYRQKGVDSLVTLISTLGGGTVLSVSAGTGMNFTTITTSGSVNADTNVLATRANRDKLKDSLQANIAAKVNISDTATMLSAYLRKADTTSMLSPYLRKTDTTAMLTPYVRIAGFGLTKGTQALSVDSALMATRARVQKGIDSVASLVTTTDSVLFSTRAWRQKGVDSVAALANTKATATGTTNYLSKFTGTSSLGNSIVYATTSEVGISTPSPTHPLDVNGRVRVRTIDSTATGMNMLYADVDGVIKKAAPPAGGTVTSVAAGTGMSFTTITTTGSVSADTVALATRAWRQKGIDSLAASEVSIADTATMLNPYTRGSGIIGYIPKWSATRSIDTSQIFQVADRIGIGTTTVNSLARMAINGNLHFDHTDGREIRSNGPGTFRINNPADQGIIEINTGTTSGFASKINVQGGFVNSGGAGSNIITFTTASNERARFTAAGRLLVGTTTEGTNTVDIAGTLRSTQGANFATASGNVGIGTSSPINTTNYTTVTIGGGSTNRGQLTFNSSTTAVGYLYNDATNMNIGSDSALIFQTSPGANERMRITSGGNVGISTGAVPSERLDVNGRVRVRTIDSTSSPINVLTSDVTGVIRKTAMPSTTVDTLSISTRAWRQKGVDSASSLIAAKLNISDTSGMLTNYTRGSGVADYIPKWTSTRGLDSSSLSQRVNGRIGYKTTTDAGFDFDINGTMRSSTITVNTNGQGRTLGTQMVTGSDGANIFMGGAGGSLAFDPGLTYQGSYNTAIGVNALSVVSKGFSNVGIGAFAGDELTTGFNNTMIGRDAATKVTTGFYNTALGAESLSGLTTGILNVGVGQSAGSSVGSTGTNPLQTNSRSIFIGNDTRASANGNTNEIVIGDTAKGNGSNTTTIGNPATTTTFLLGKLDIGTIDSTASAINMLYADASGVIKKTAVPAAFVDSVKMRSNTITAASGWTIGEETANNTSINQVVRTEDLASNTTVHVNTMLYKTTNTFTTGSWVHIGTVPVGYRPTNVVYFSLPNLVDGASFQATNDTDFTAVAQYSGGTSLRIKANGEIDVYVTTVDASADLSGANYVLIPVVVSYPVLTLTN